MCIDAPEWSDGAGRLHSLEGEKKDVSLSFKISWPISTVSAGTSLLISSWDLSSNFIAWGLRWWRFLTRSFPSDGPFFSRIFAWRSVDWVNRTFRIDRKTFCIGFPRDSAPEIPKDSESCETQHNCGTIFTIPSDLQRFGHCRASSPVVAWRMSYRVGSRWHPGHGRLEPLMSFFVCTKHGLKGRRVNTPKRWVAQHHPVSPALAAGGGGVEWSLWTGMGGWDRGRDLAGDLQWSGLALWITGIWSGEEGSRLVRQKGKWKGVGRKRGEGRGRPQRFFFEKKRPVWPSGLNHLEIKWQKASAPVCRLCLKRIRYCNIWQASLVWMLSTDRGRALGFVDFGSSGCPGLTLELRNVGW